MSMLNSKFIIFPKITSEDIKELAREVKEPIYAMGDESAIKVINGEISVVSEVEWEKFN